MAWPLTRLPPGSGEARSFEGTLVGTFYTGPKGHREIISGFYSYSYKPSERLEILKSLDDFRTLKEDVLVKLSNYTFKRCKHLVYTWRAIEDNLRLASVPILCGLKPKIVYRLWKWCVSQHAYNPNLILTQWKVICDYFRRWAAGEEPPRIPRDIPGTQRGQLNHEWYELFPWLWELYHSRLTKEGAENVTMASQTRNFPVPLLTESREREEIFQFQEELQKPRVQRPYWLKERAMALGTYVRSLVTKNHWDLFPHISASFSASEDKSRSEGGKGIEILKLFLDRFVSELAPLTLSGETWFGCEYKVVKGVPKIYTMCRDAPLNLKFRYFLSSSFRTWDAPETLAHMFVVGNSGGQPEKVLEESIWGLDRELPKQLYQLCIEELIRKGFFPGIQPHRNPLDTKAILLCEHTWTKPIVCRAHCVREPGGKIRWVTMEPAYVNMFIQPIAHMVANGLGLVPSLYSAFNRSWKAWDFGDMLAIREQSRRKRSFKVGVYDLTSASNNLDRGVTREIVGGFFRTFFPDTLEWRAYLTLIMSILFRDRHVFLYRSEETREIRHQFRATNGLLMGNAFTKEALVLISEVIHRQVAYSLKGDLAFSTCWLIAGDDVALYCNRETFQRITDTHRALGNVVKKEKTFFSHKYVPFCQGGLFLGAKMFHGKRLMFVPYGETIVTDTIMSRLLTPYGVESLMANPTAKNPVIGKGAALSAQLKYYPRKTRVGVVISLFHRNMGQLIPRDPMAFLPGEIGGYGLPHTIPLDILYQRILDEASPVLFPIFRLLKTGKRVPVWLEFLLRDARSGVSARGLENPTLDPMIKEYEAALLNYAKVESWTFQDLQKECSTFFKEKLGRDPLTMNDDDVRRYAKARGLMNSYEFAIHVDRSSALRIFFVVAAGLIPLDIAVPKREKIPSPSSILEGFRSNEYWMRVKYDPFQDIRELFELENMEEGLSLFREWFFGGQKPVNKCLGNIYLHKSCYRDSLNGMRVPINSKRDPKEPYVKGSIRDPYFEPDQDLFIGATVHIDRLGRSKRFS